MNLSINTSMISSARGINFIIFISCVLLILMGIYMEHVMRLIPCPLCITQRAFINLTGILAFVAFIHNPKTKGRRIYASLGIVAALGGAYFAQHHVWLQSLPADQAPACGPGLAYMFETFPLMEAFTLLLQGDGSCAVPHAFLGWTIPGWTLIAFIGLALMNAYQLMRKN